MSITLERRLDIILEDANQAFGGADPYQDAINVATELEEARRRVTDLERQLIHATDKLCGGLALGVRQRQPGLNIGLSNGNCRVGYKSKHLMLKPDIANRVWVIDASDPIFGRRFKRLYGRHTNLNNDFSAMATAVGEFFTNHYKTLGEDIAGIGCVMIDGKRVAPEQLLG